MLAGTLGVVTLGVPAGASGNAGGTTAPPAAPLATTVQSDAGTWATLPMGHLGQPLNTFWQLFFQPTGGGAWSNKVEATATATNGGLVLAAASGRPFIAGVRPSNLLGYSPLIATTNGKAWSDGLLPAGLTITPAALSTTATTTAALVGRAGAARVLLSDGAALTRWHTLTSTASLARADSACGLATLTAVAATPSGAFVGGSCRHAGIVPLYGAGRGGTHDLAVSLPASLRHDRVAVLSVRVVPLTTAEALSGASPVSSTSSAPELTVLLEAEGAGGTVLLEMSRSASGWQASGSLALGKDHLASIGADGPAGYFALRTAPGGGRALATVAPGQAWVSLPAPPATTATVDFGSVPGAVDALAALGSTMTVWSLAPGAATWTAGQRVHVTLEIGSST